MELRQNNDPREEFDWCPCHVKENRHQCAGNAGTQYLLFLNENTRMFYGDAKERMDGVLKNILKT